MMDHLLAARLLTVVGVAGSGIKSAVDAGEDAIAIAELIELAATNSIAVPRDLLQAVSDLADEQPSSLDDGDIAALREDLATLNPLALSA